MNYNLNKIQKEIKQLQKLQLENIKQDTSVTHNYVERRFNNIERQLNKIKKIVSASKLKRYITIIILFISVYKYYKYFKNRDIVKEAKDITSLSINNTKEQILYLIQTIKNMILSLKENNNEEI